MGNDGIIISDSAPTNKVKATWLKILEDSSREWYELVDNSWVLTKTEAAPAAADHTHATHGNINFTGTVSADGQAGITGEYEGTFKKIKVQDGLVVDFELN
jgi:hypothetical protein